MTPLFIACIAAFISLFLNSLNYFIVPESARIFLHEMKFILYVITPVFSLIYLLNKYYDKKRNIRKSVLKLLFLVAFETIVLITNPLHHFIRKSITIPINDIPIIVTENNIGFYVFFIIQFSIFIYTVIFLFQQIKKHYKKDRQLILIAIFSVCLPIICSPIFVITSNKIISSYDWLFPLFAFPIIGFSIIEIYTNIIKRTPYARGDIFESLPYPIILINRKGYIIDLNTMAKKLKISLSDKVSKLKIFQTLRNKSPITWHNSEVSIKKTTYKIHASFIDTELSKKSKSIALILHDVSMLNEYIEILEYNNYHDLLTGLYNRKWLDNNLNFFLQSSRYPLGILVTDINKFKIINDKYGHEAGDKALIYFAKSLKEVFLENAYTIRFGGDEFLVLFPNTSENELKQLISAFQIHLSKSTVTAAIGYTIRYNNSENFDKNIKEADQLMYENKEAFYNNENT